MKIPEQVEYKDVHAGFRQTFPTVTEQRIHEYLQQFDKTVDRKCHEMYEERQVIKTFCFQTFDRRKDLSIVSLSAFNMSYCYS